MAAIAYGLEDNNFTLKQGKAGNTIDRPLSLKFCRSSSKSSHTSGCRWMSATNKGNSIENQQRIIENFIIENPDFELYDTYIDEGVLGTTFERTSFQRMLLDAEEQRIGCIIIKDLSRFEEVGLEVLPAIVKLENIASQCMIKKTGFTKYGMRSMPDENGHRL